MNDDRIRAGGRYPQLAAPAFPDDDGRVDPLLSGALGDVIAVLGVLATARVFVPIIAVLDDSPAAGDKNADMAAVMMTGVDGRTALLAFTSVASMAAWDALARPVPVYGRDAARTALDEGAAALLLDLADPTFLAIETADLVHLAAGHNLGDTAAGPAWLT